MKLAAIISIYLFGVTPGDGGVVGGWILDRGLRGGGPARGRSPFWRTPKESCHGKVSLSLRGSAGSARYLKNKLSTHVCFSTAQDLLQSCSRGGGRIVEDMCYERRRAEACVD